MKLIVDNLATEYTDQGTGPVILMLHGWMDNLHTFDKIADNLQNKYRIIRLDMPGFGQTEMPKEIWNVSKYVAFVSHFLEKADIRPDVVLGHSFGGRVTIKGVSDGVFRPKKIILVGSAGISKRITLRNIVITILAKIFGLLTLIPPLLFYRHQIRRRAYEIIGSDYLQAGLLKDTYIQTISEDLKESAKNILLPTLLLWGENDTETPLADGKTFNKLINGSKLMTIPKAGHLVHKEQSAEVVKFIEDFIR